MSQPTGYPHMSLHWPLRAVVLILVLSFVERSETFSNYQITPISFKSRVQVQRRAAAKPDSSSPYQEDWGIQSSSNNKNDDRLNSRSKFRKMNLTWCNKVSCRGSTFIREQIVGEQNQIAFRGSATGQVLFSWELDELISNTTYVPRVLVLVRKNDDALMKVAENAIKELISNGDIIVEITTDVASKCNFVESSEFIHIVEPKPVHGIEGHPSALDDYTYEILESNFSDRQGASNPDLVCTLGGDGLLMYASMLFPGPCPPILCVAGGSLGFLTLFTRDEMVDAIRCSLGLLENDQDVHFMNHYASSPSWYSDSQRAESKTNLAMSPCIRMSMRMRLDCIISNRQGVVQARYSVLNELVIDRGSSPYLASLECFVDDVHMTTVQGDGIIFSTPTGSTAYSMSAGGSVCHPAVPAILVTPICPHVLSFRSMIFPDHVTFRCYVSDDARADAAIAFDGKHRRELKRGDQVQIKMCQYPVPTINKIDHSADWLTSLKKNFNFNARPRQEPL